MRAGQNAKGEYFVRNLDLEHGRDPDSAPAPRIVGSREIIAGYLAALATQGQLGDMEVKDGTDSLVVSFGDTVGADEHSDIRLLPGAVTTGTAIQPPGSSKLDPRMLLKP